MRIQIAERLRPYSHLPGTEVVLPGSTYSLQVFPCLIRISDLSLAKPSNVGQIELNLIGPLKDFTIQQDLEAGCIKVWGTTAHGFIRYVLNGLKDGKGLLLQVEKGLATGLEIVANGKNFILQVKEKLAVFATNDSNATCAFPLTERLSLGNHKAQDWEFVKRRIDLTEIFPAWNRLGHLLPRFKMLTQATGALHLLQECQHLIACKKNEDIMNAFCRLFQAGFTGLLAPRLEDELHQGLIFNKSSPTSDASPLLLLTEGARLIRSIFIEEQDNIVHVLPVLPAEFHCGRFLHIPLQGGIISLEWTKKIIRRLVFQATESQELTFHFRKIKQFRLRRSESEKGKTYSQETPLYFEKNCYYLFDNFT